MSTSSSETSLEVYVEYPEGAPPHADEEVSRRPPIGMVM